MTKCTEKLQNGITIEYDYQYDKDGNRSKYVKTVNGEWTECYTYEYNAANQLVSRTNERLWTDNVTYYSYDGNGNRISEQTGLFEKTYEYTAENRLAVVKAQGTVLMAALYDGDGNRLFTMDYTGENNERWDIWIPEIGGNADKVDDSAKDAMKELAGLVSVRDRRDYTITEYVNDITRENEEVLAELNPRGKVTTAYTYGYHRESADVNGDAQYYLYDGQGNVSRISSEWGRVKETYNYDPYGNLTYGIPDTVNYYGYNGESSNLATGLQYLRARYYNPQTGSFITEDTYPGQIRNPLSLNRYDYVSNNPVNYIDPSGHFGILEELGKQIGKAINNVGTAIGNGLEKIGEGLNALGNAYMQGQQLIQQTQRMEEQAVHDLITGKGNQGNKNNQSSQNKLQQALEDKKPQKRPEPEEKDKGILEQIGEGFVKLSQMYSSVEEQKRQLEEEQSRAFCETLQTKEGQKVLANVLGVGAGIAVGVFAAPAVAGYIGLTGTGALVFANVSMGSIGNSVASFLNALIDEKPAEEIATDTGLAFVDGAILGVIGGYAEAGIAKLFGLFKGTAVYKTILKYFDDIFGIADDIDNVKIPVEDGNNTITDDVVEEVVEGGGKTTKELMSESDSALKWGVLDDGTNQGVKHFNEYWDKYPERIPSLEKRLGLPEGTFDNTLDGFNNFTEQAERVVREATEIGNVRNINGKSIYYIDGIENAKKGVVVIMKDGKIQTMMPSDFKSFNKMQ